ncbi:MAG: DUF5060 domain-containing protein [Bacteroidota bacterium]
MIIRSFLVISLFLPVYLMGQPLIKSISPNLSSVEKYGKFEVALDIEASFTNPYDYDQIEVFAEFTSPDGNQTQTVDGFFMEDYILNTNGSLVPDGSGFKIRFAPSSLGNWTYQIFVKDSNGTTSSALLNFSCGNINSPENKGFLRTNQTHYLSFDEGDQFVLLGENICWQNGNPYTDYKKWLDSLDSHGGNFFRLWHAHWGLGIEWKDNWNNFKGLRQYKEVNMRYQDWLFDYSASKGIYIMLALQHHGPVSTQVNPNWNDSPYNTANGGPCQSTADFFTDSTARAHTRNRYRYILARWGYSRAILAWELFNEVEWTDNYEANKGIVRDWHEEMAAYLKSHDPYNHIVTTSFAKEQNDPLLWVNPDMDITQTHHYVNTPNIERVLISSVRSYLEEFDKPTLTGEFGIGLSSTLKNVDPDGIHIHNGLWGALFGGGMGTGMTWWWDIYIHPQDLYYHFDGLAAITKDIPFLEGNMKPTDAFVTGTTGDLIISPTLDWGVQGADSIFINQDGSLSPSNPGSELSTFLYGSQWNTQFRSPPVFVAYFPTAGTFTIRTGGGSGQAPRINVRLNGNQVLSQAASTNSQYVVNVNAGLNYLKVDNTGTDWINIAGYEFAGLGSKLDAYALQSEDNKIAAGYILYNEYNHEDVLASGAPTPVSGGVLEMDGFHDSTYFVKWYNCLTGAIDQVEPVTVTGGKISVNVPTTYWDYAFIIDEKDAMVTSVAKKQALAFEAYPNPIQSGKTLTLDLQSFQQEEVSIELLDMSGRTIQKSIHQASSSRLSYSLSDGIAKGFYWIKVSGKEKVGVKALVIN